MLVGARDAGGRAARGGDAARGRRPERPRLAPPGVAALHRAARHVFLRRHGGTVVAMTHWGCRAIRRASSRCTAASTGWYAVVLARSVRRHGAAAARQVWRAWQLLSAFAQAEWRLREAHTRGGFTARFRSGVAARTAIGRRRARAPPARARMRRRPRSASRCTRSSAPSPPPRSSSAAADRAAPRTRPGARLALQRTCAAWAASDARCDAAQAAARVRARVDAPPLGGTRARERGEGMRRGGGGGRGGSSAASPAWRLRAASRVVDAWTAHAATRPRLAARRSLARVCGRSPSRTRRGRRVAPPTGRCSALAERRRRRKLSMRTAHGRSARTRRRGGAGSCARRRRPTARRAGCSCAGVRLRSWARCSDAPTPIVAARAAPGTTRRCAAAVACRRRRRRGGRCAARRAAAARRVRRARRLRRSRGASSSRAAEWQLPLVRARLAPASDGGGRAPRPLIISTVAHRTRPRRFAASLRRGRRAARRGGSGCRCAAPPSMLRGQRGRGRRCASIGTRRRGDAASPKRPPRATRRAWRALVARRRVAPRACGASRPRRRA